MLSPTPQTARRVLLSVLILACSGAYASDKARIVVVGDLDEINIGQAGYCGERVNVPPNARQRIYVQGGERVWFRMRTVAVHGFSSKSTCSGEYNFLPEADRAYILRFTDLGRRCLFELFQVVPGEAPKQEALERSEPEICLLK